MGTGLQSGTTWTLYYGVGRWYDSMTYRGSGPADADYVLGTSDGESKYFTNRGWLYWWASTQRWTFNMPPMPPMVPGNPAYYVGVEGDTMHTNWGWLYWHTTDNMWHDWAPGTVFYNGEYSPTTESTGKWWNTETGQFQDTDPTDYLGGVGAGDPDYYAGYTHGDMGYFPTLDVWLYWNSLTHRWQETQPDPLPIITFTPDNPDYYPGSYEGEQNYLAGYESLYWHELLQEWRDWNPWDFFMNGQMGTSPSTRGMYYNENTHDFQYTDPNGGSQRPEGAYHGMIDFSYGDTFWNDISGYWQGFDPSAPPYFAPGNIDGESGTGDLTGLVWSTTINGWVNPQYYVAA